MKTSLLTSLRNFHPREGHDPLENFVTEAFAWLLINYEGFGRFYLSKVRQCLELGETKFGEIEWDTRANLGGVYPDLVGKTETHTYLFEHKTWSPLHHNQLSNYRREALKSCGEDNYHLILVAGGRHLFDQDPDLALCWHEIHAWITEWRNHKEYDDDPLFKDFQKLLENEGMGPPAPISHESIVCYKPAQPFESSLVSLVQRAAKYDWKERFPLIATDPQLPWHRSLSGGKDPWGRIGINLAGNVEHSPHGCFLGFLIDPTDHCVEWQTPGSPDFGIILGASPILCPNYYKSDRLSELTKALSLAVDHSCPEFELLDHFATCNDPNRWHPIHIRMPMIDLFRGTTTADEQYQQFINKASLALSCLVALPEFRAFLSSLPSTQTTDSQS